MLGTLVPDDTVRPGVTRVIDDYRTQPFRRQPLATRLFRDDAGDGAGVTVHPDEQVLVLQAVAGGGYRATGRRHGCGGSPAVQPVHRAAERRQVGDHHGMIVVAGALAGEDLLDADGRAVAGGDGSRRMRKLERHPDSPAD